MRLIWHFYQLVWNQVDGWDTQQWLIAFAVVVAAGTICLRGFGSRTSY